jgi:hypothetical protein
MKKAEQIELLEYKILKLKQELPMLCDSDYYNQCDLIEQYKIELEKLESKGE